jgi:hypothetical protein
MNNYTVVIALACSLALSGCQSWSFRDIQELPPTAALPQVRTQGEVQIRYWYNQTGVQTSTITTLASYPDRPDDVGILSSLVLPESKGDNYGAMVQGLISPPETGLYRFFVAGDDQTEFWLGTSDQPDSAEQIAIVPGWTGTRNYTKYESQKSGLIELQEGNFYYFQLLYKQGGGGSHFSVAWEGPGIEQQTLSGPALYSLSSSQYPDDENSEASFLRGYAIGHFDASQGLGYDPSYPPLDKDSDGLYDNWEAVYGLSTKDPTDADSDSDNDLMTATDEFLAGTRPDAPDTDSDGIPDGVEYAFNMDPTDPSDANRDMDGDGATNLEEYEAGTRLNDPDDVPDTGPDYVTGYTGQYFTGRNFESLVLVRNDEAIDFNWGGGSPAPDIPTDHFSVRWSGFFEAPHASGSNTYEFQLTTDDGARLYLGNDLVIDQWVPRGATTNIATRDIEAGALLPITVEYFEVGSGARAQLAIIDNESGTTLNQSNVMTTLDPSVSSEQDTDGDGIPDTWELTYGTSMLIPDADLVLNSSGMTTIDAYSSNLDPRSLDPLSGSAPAVPESEPPDSTTSPGATVQLAWTAPGTRTDGSSISLSEIDRYEIAYGQDPDALTNTVPVESGEDSYTFTELPTGEWYFSIRVYDTNGLASELSEPVNYTVE